MERLDQACTRADNGANGPRYDYRAPVFDFEARLEYDRSGLVLDHPGIATRIF